MAIASPAPWGPGSAGGHCNTPTMRVATVAFAALAILAWCSTASATTTKVMTRNLYLGADVGVALKQLPDMPAAAQFMWEQVQATDITRRAPLFAAEAAREHPDVIGLQEATTWSCKKSGSP